MSHTRHDLWSWGERSIMHHVIWLFPLVLWVPGAVYALPTPPRHRTERLGKKSVREEGRGVNLIYFLNNETMKWVIFLVFFRNGEKIRFRTNLFLFSINHLQRAEVRRSRSVIGGQGSSVNPELWPWIFRSNFPHIVGLRRCSDDRVGAK